MKNSKDRKKLHHYVHAAYLDEWRDASNTLYVYDLSKGKSFPKTGRDIAAEGQFNDFSFDPVVMDLLRYALSKRLDQVDRGDPAEIMLELIAWIKDEDYRHKEHNFFEDFFEEFEKKIGVTLSEVKRAESAVGESSSDWGLYLLFFYFLQLFRVPKARDLFSGDFIWSTPDGSMTLDDRQKREFLMAHLLINALCAASDVHAMGFRIRLRFSGASGKLINSDAPAVVTSSRIKSLKELEGWMPLTSRILMEIDRIGWGTRLVMSDRINSDAIRRYNASMTGNARTFLFFNSASQRSEHVRTMMRLS